MKELQEEFGESKDKTNGIVSEMSRQYTAMQEELQGNINTLEKEVKGLENDITKKNEDI